MNQLYVAVGVNGVGKSTVIKTAVEGTEVQVVSFGELITRLMIDGGVATSRDDLRKNADQATWIKYQTMTAQEIGRMQGQIVVDTHAAVPSPHGYYPGLPPHVLNNFSIPPSVIFVVEADPEDIYVRRNNDATRVRDHDFERGLDLIRQHQDINRAFAAAYCASTCARLKIVQNNNGGLEQAVKEVRNTLLGV